MGWPSIHSAVHTYAATEQNSGPKIDFKKIYDKENQCGLFLRVFFGFIFGFFWSRNGTQTSKCKLKMAITWRGSIALRGDFSSTKGRASRVDLQEKIGFFARGSPPGRLPRRLFSHGERALVRRRGGNLAARGSAPGPRAPRRTGALGSSCAPHDPAQTFHLPIADATSPPAEA